MALRASLRVPWPTARSRPSVNQSMVVLGPRTRGRSLPFINVRLAPDVASLGLRWWLFLLGYCSRARQHRPRSASPRSPPSLALPHAWLAGRRRPGSSLPVHPWFAVLASFDRREWNRSGLAPLPLRLGMFSFAFRRTGSEPVLTRIACGGSVWVAVVGRVPVRLRHSAPPSVAHRAPRRPRIGVEVLPWPPGGVPAGDARRALPCSVSAMPPAGPRERGHRATHEQQSHRPGSSSSTARDPLMTGGGSPPVGMGHLAGNSTRPTSQLIRRMSPNPARVGDP